VGNVLASTGTLAGTYANTLSYVLDAVGNWTSRTVNGTTTSYTYDSADRITAAGTNSYTWNDDGSLASRTVGGTTTSFTWDYEAQLTALSSGPGFTYDASGRRVSRTAGGTTTTFLHDGGAVLLEQQSGTTTANYTYGNALLSRSGETQHFDGLGSARTTTSSTEVINATGTYEAYGQSLGGTGSSATPYCYGATSGYRNDGDAGLLHIGARWYDPSIGRWISADTYLGDVTSPLERNRYLYCNGDPVNYTDPTGHVPWWVVLGGGIAALGGAAGVLLILDVTYAGHESYEYHVMFYDRMRDHSPTRRRRNAQLEELNRDPYAAPHSPQVPPPNYTPPGPPRR
jgi:RHS repeat-associated protein